LFGAIVAQRDAFDAKYTVNGTPMFVINGKKLDGPNDLASFDKALAPFLKK
jgi:protein-disulfide isomerase